MGDNALSEFSAGKSSITFLLNKRHAPWIEHKRVPLDPESRVIFAYVVAFMVVAYLTGLYMLFENLQIQSTQAHLDQTGVNIQGSVTGERIETGENNSYYITYSFQPDPDSDQVYSKEARVGVGYHARATRDQVVTIRYLPSDPSVSHIVEFPPSVRFPYWTIAIILVPSPLVGLILFRAFRNRRRLFSEGQVLHGELVSFVGRMDRGSYYVTVGYRFKSPLGIPIEGKTRGNYNALKNALTPEPGTPLAVLYVDDKLHQVL
jgi:hypothetical protein